MKVTPCARYLTAINDLGGFGDFVVAERRVLSLGLSGSPVAVGRDDSLAAVCEFDDELREETGFRCRSPLALAVPSVERADGVVALGERIV